MLQYGSEQPVVRWELDMSETTTVVVIIGALIDALRIMRFHTNQISHTWNLI